MFGYGTRREIDPSGYAIIEFDTTDIDKIYYNINTRIEKLNNEGTFPVRLRFVTRNGIGIINFNDMAVISIYFLRVTLVENKNDAEDKSIGTLGFITLGNWDIAQRKVIVNEEQNMLEEIINSVFNLTGRVDIVSSMAYCAAVDLEEIKEEKSEE